MTVTKDHIVNSICRQLDIPKKKSADLLESLLEMIQKNLENGEDVLISGFGKFCVKSKNAAKRKKSRDRARFDARVKTGGDFQVFPYLASESQLERGVKSRFTLSRFPPSQGPRDNGLLAFLDRSV